MDMNVLLELRVIATMIDDWCRNREDIIYDRSLCTQERILRFSTETLKKLFPDTNKPNSVWKTNKQVMYEIYNGEDEFYIVCTISKMGLPSKEKKRCQKLIGAFGNDDVNNGSLCYLKVWKFPGVQRDVDKIKKAFDYFFENDFPVFEQQLQTWLDNENAVFVAEDSDELLSEGGRTDVLTNKYERNKVARKKCIEHYGAICQICGFNFGRFYGKDLEGKIEVHHKVPLYLIREEYVVDPINDLVPLCSNCHTVIHSKKDGVYTVEEVKKMIVR